MRHCPNCDGEVIVWDDELQADKCVDCGESWTLEEQAVIAIEELTNPPDSHQGIGGSCGQYSQHQARQV
jgi:hypothetical protein